MKGRIVLDLTERLLAVASFVRKDTFLIDVGTDHAYLPIYLAGRGDVRACIASDIHEGPCESARAHIAVCGLTDKIKVVRTDGLCGLSASGMTDIVIAGMGGTLISEILSCADFIKNGDIRLILQPMRNIPDLRKYLYENGFDIADEALAREEDRIYEIICASYDGVKREKSELVLTLGEKNIENKNTNAALFSAFCEKQASALTKKINGMRVGGADTSAQEALLAQIEAEKTNIPKEE